MWWRSHNVTSITKLIYDGKLSDSNDMNFYKAIFVFFGGERIFFFGQEENVLLL